MTSKNYWFKAKNYGWGWYPVTWQGWLVTLLFIFLIVSGFTNTDSQAYSADMVVINFLPKTLVLTGLLIAVCYIKGEKPEWRWGGKKIKF